MKTRVGMVVEKGKKRRRKEWETRVSEGRRRGKNQTRDEEGVIVGKKEQERRSKDGMNE